MTMLNDAFDDWLNNGIFSYIDDYKPPWQGVLTTLELNSLYHGGRSGAKPIAPIITNFLNDAEKLTVEQLRVLAGALYNLYGINWKKQWDTLNFEYNPIENYSMTENEKNTSAGERSDVGTNIRSKTGNDKDDFTNKSTIEHAGTDHFDKSTTIENNGTDTSSIYGFNSGEAMGANEGVTTTNTTTTDTTEETKDLTDTENTTSSNTTTYNTTDSESINSKITNNDSNDRSLTRKGNIGVTTSQQMIESEHNLWMWNYFEQIVFKNIDDWLTLRIY